MDPIIQQLREARREAGMSLNRLAAASGIAKGFLSEVEAGKHGISIATARRWATALDHDLALVKREG